MEQSKLMWYRVVPYGTEKFPIGQTVLYGTDIVSYGREKSKDKEDPFRTMQSIVRLQESLKYSRKIFKSL